MAIEITTSILQMDAEHSAEKADQEWLGLLARQQIESKVEAEKSRKRLLELKAESAGVQSTGKAIAEAKAKAETLRIEGEAKVKKAELQSQAQKMITLSDLELQKELAQQEIIHQKQIAELEVNKAKRKAEIEIKKFKNQISAIGQETIISMAKAGPEFQARLLKGLGLKGFMVMDGKHPINLFNTAQSMIGQQS